MELKLSSLALIRQDIGITPNYNANPKIISGTNSFADLLKGSESAGQFFESASITANFDGQIDSLSNANSNAIDNYSAMTDESKNDVSSESKVSESNQSEFILSESNKNKSDIDQTGLDKREANQKDTNQKDIKTGNENYRTDSEINQEELSQIESKKKDTQNNKKSNHLTDEKKNQQLISHQLQIQTEIAKAIGISGSIKTSTTDLINSENKVANFKDQKTANKKIKEQKTGGHKTLDSASTSVGQSGNVTDAIQTGFGGKVNSNMESVQAAAKKKIDHKQLENPKVTVENKQPLPTAENANQVQATINAAITNQEESKDKLGLNTDKWNIVSEKASRVSTKSEASNSNTNTNSKNENQGDTHLKNETLIKTDTVRSFEKSASLAELENGVRQGFQDLIKKANLQIGRDGNASAQIRMNPNHLGFMSVDMKVEQNRIVLKILVDRQDVLDQLKKDIEILRGEFIKTGLQVDSISLKLREPFETSFNSNSSNSEQAQTGDFNSSSKDQESNREFYSTESYFESAQSKVVEPVNQESIEAEILPIRSSSRYENQLVMNLSNPNSRNSFTA